MNCVFSGFSFQDVLLLVGATARSGELVLESGNNIGSIIFHSGRILQAFSPYSRAIGDLLVDEAIISDAELIEMLQEQKKKADCPLGSLFLKTGKVSYEEIEIMVHEQIREAMKEFSTWPNMNLSFIDKEIKPFDNIHLPVYEFLPEEVLNSGNQFFSKTINLQDRVAGQSLTPPLCN